MKTPKVNITYREKKPKVQYEAIYTNVIDPEYFRKVTAPVLFKAMEEARQINSNKVV